MTSLWKSRWRPLWRVASSESLQNYLAMARISEGRRLLLSGQEEEGLILVHEALPLLLGSEFAWFAPLVTEAILALGKSGSGDEARELIDDALRIAIDKGADWWLAELHRAKGELVQNINSGDATASFQKAIEVAKQQGAGLLELRAATSLAVLWSSEGRGQGGQGPLGQPLCAIHGRALTRQTLRRPRLC